MFKISNGNKRTICEIFLKLTIKTPEFVLEQCNNVVATDGLVLIKILLYGDKFMNKFGSVLNEVSFLFCRFLKSGVTNELKSLFLLKSKKVKSYLFQTWQNCAAHKTLVWSTYVYTTATANIFLKKKE